MRFLRTPFARILIAPLILLAASCPDSSYSSSSSTGSGGAGTSVRIPAFSIAIEANQKSGAVGDQFRLSASGMGRDTDDSDWTWKWDIGSTTSMDRSIEVSFDSPGTKTATVTAINENGQVETVSIALTVFDSPGNPRLTATGIALPAIIGDVDGDGLVNLTDCHRIARHAGQVDLFDTGDSILAADVDLDGEITIEDANLLSLAVIQNQSTPSVLSPSSGARGTAITLVSPALMADSGRVEVKVGSHDPYEPYRPILGYATCMVPVPDSTGMEGEGATIPVQILVDGEVKDSFSFSVTAPPERTSSIGSMLEDGAVLSQQLRTRYRSLLESYLDQTNALPEEAGVLLGLFDVANEEALAAEAAMEDLMKITDPAIIEQIEYIANVNGLQATLDEMRVALSGAQALPSTSGEELFQLLCELKQISSLLNAFGSAVGLGCDVWFYSGVALIVIPEPGSTAAGIATLTAWLNVCGKAEIAIDLIATIDSFVGNPQAEVDLVASTNSPEPGETVELRGFVPVSGLDSICKDKLNGTGGDIVKKISEAATKRFLNKKLSLRAVAELLKKVSEKASEKFIGTLESAVSAVVNTLLDITGINVALTSLVDRICGTLGTGVPIPVELAGSLQGPIPNVGTLQMPPPGSTAPALYTCETGSTAEPAVEFTLTKDYCGQVISDTETINCGSNDVTITMGDNGSLLDDIFEVRVNGQTVLTSSVPVRSVSTTLPLALGEHSVNMIGLAAPDGVGTYFIDFDGASVVSGPPTSGSNLSAGTVFTWTISVP